MTDWKGCKNILCVRLDNMGDLLMSEPALRALKETFGCTITLLTSSAAQPMAKFLSAVEDVIVWDAPWVKHEKYGTAEFISLVRQLRERQFDGAVIFTVFSQNPLPTAMTLLLAEIPRRLAYCRENPYGLLTDWIPDPEPYSVIRHQVIRDLSLVETIGANVADTHLRLQLDPSWSPTHERLRSFGVDLEKPWIILHPGVSEEKRKYPEALWIQAARLIIEQLQLQIVITGGVSERTMTDRMAAAIGNGAFSVAGNFSLEALMLMIRKCRLLLSVNTVTIHIAAALDAKVVLLYALTNPQHAPWKGIGKVLPFPVNKTLASRNEVLKFVSEQYFKREIPLPSPAGIVRAVEEVAADNYREVIPELLAGDALSSATTAVRESVML